MTDTDGNLLDYIAGIDLGKMSDPSALALLERRMVSQPVIKSSLGFAVHTRKPPNTYHIPTLQRWPLGTNYQTIVANVVAFLQSPPLNSVEPLLVVDATGVGSAVCEMFQQELIKANVAGGFVAVTITAGSAVTQGPGPGQWRVAKQQLASILQVLLGHRRLHVAADQGEAKTLVRELGTFTVKITPAGNETFSSWRERDHDDLVLAVALGLWAGESLDWPQRSNFGPSRLMTN